MIDPRAEYDRRLAFWRERIARLDRLHLVISRFRLAVAACVAVAMWLANGKMVFDYRMRPGVVERSNALALMRAIGLEI